MFKGALKALGDRLERWIAPLLLMALLITLLLVAPTSGGLGEQSAQAAGNTIYVDAGAASGADNGTSWADAFTTLQPALDAAVAGDEIWVAAGTYNPTVEHGGTGDRYRSFQMKNGVAIYGGFSGMEGSLEERDWVLHETVLSGDIGIEGDPTDNCYHVFYHPEGTGLNSTAVLDGFTVSDGIANGGGNHEDGGGMFNDGSSPTVANCIFAGNEASANAGSIGSGGGVYNRDSSSPILIDCTFTGNSAGYGGGGMANAYGSSPTLINCVFRGNWSQWFGGGLHNHYSTPTLLNCTFSRNVAQWDHGGGMTNDQAAANLINCTFSGNSAREGGGGIYNGYSTYYGIPTTLTNCILWGNSPNEIENYWSTTLAVYSDIQGGYTGEGNINADPLFVDPANGDFHLGSGSPCIDTGDNSADDLPGLDFEGDARIMDGNTDGIAIVDMGVDEIGTPTDCQARINDDAVVYTNVQSAVDAAGVGDLVKVAGYCAGAQSREGVTQTVYLSKTLTIQGGYTTTNWIAPNHESNPTTLDAQGQGRVLYITGNISPTIEGLRITGGDAAGQGGSPWGSDSGGGVYVVDATATISDCAVLGNDAGLSGVGGGLYLLRSDSTLSGNTIEGNTADDPLDGYGGGLYLRASPALLRDNTVAANSANNDGGGIYLDMSDANLSGNTIISNHANSNGGGLHLWENSNAIIEGNTIVSNTAHLGGGMSIYYSPATVTGNEVRGNDAYAGGGAYLLYSESELTQNTFSFNSASWSGGGVHLMVSISTFSNNQVLSNTADFGGGLSLVGDTAMLVENMIQGNIANHTGGGIHLSETNPSVRGNVISDNTANLTGDWQGGGGMFLDVCHGTFEGNIIVDNSAMNGGGIYLHANSNSSFRNNVIAGNNAGNIGSGLYISESHPELVHTTFALNQGGEGSAVLVASDSSLSMTNTILVSHTMGISVSAGGSAHLDGTLWGAGDWANGTDWAGDGTILTGTTNVWGDPAFIDPDAGDYHISLASAARDAGVEVDVTDDMDGDPRPQGAGYDIGADEFPFCDNVTEIPQAECEALVALYISTDGPNWTDSTGWMAATTPCSWFGVSCVAGHVSNLDLTSNRLSGSIPPELNRLDNLQILGLGNNQLNESIPPELGSLTNLMNLYLDRNQLSGGIPPEIAGLSSLQVLSLWSNQLSDSIPRELGSLHSLQYLYLNSNQLSGTIPPELGGLSSLAYIDLSINQLSGNIPPELGDLANLRRLPLSMNQLSGIIPPELGDLANLEYLALYGNQLSGDIPLELGSLTNLQCFDIDSNELSGTIPPELGSLASLVELRLSNNQLTGTIPSELGNLTSLQYLNLQSNQLEGEIPTSITSLTQLGNEYYADLGYNMLTASDPAVIAFLNDRDPDWADTQTVPPTDLEVTIVTASSLELSWSPISYTWDGGYYEVSYGISPGGPYSEHGTTADKTASGFLVGGLLPNTTYHFVVRTYTPAHDDQQNDLWSWYSEQVSATTAVDLGSLSFTVDLQGRADDSGTLFTAWSGGEEAGNCTSASDGTCSIELLAGVYSVTAEMASYLDSFWESVSISEGETVTLPTVTLLGGDTNDDCVVNIQDLAFMGYRFNVCVGDPLYDVRGDITADGCINILDLAMTGGNFNQTCPVPW